MTSMPKLLPAVLLGALLCGGAAPATSLKHTYRFDAKQVVAKQVGERQSVHVHGLPTFWEAAQPELPYDVVTLALPEGWHAVSLRATAVGEAPVLTGARLTTAQPVRNSDGREVVPKPGRGGSDTYPSSLAELCGEGTLHGTRVLFVRVHPLRYQSTSGTLWAAGEIELEIDLAPAASPAVRPLRLREERLAGATAQLRSLVANPQAVSLESQYPQKSLSMLAATESRGFHPSDAPSLEGSAVDYVIITSDELAADFQVLADWKTQRGIPSVVRTTSWIAANYRNGSDLQETIRTFIREAYMQWGVEWVLLGGDTDIVPTRYAFSSYDAVETHIPTDLYYACLDGNWNLDGDAEWGEAPRDSASIADDADLLPEVNVGRLPVSTATEVQAMVAKIQAYENPVDTQYQSKLLLLGEVLFPTNWQPGQVPYLDGAYYSEEVAAAVPVTTQTVKLYDNFANYPGSSVLTRQNTIAQMNTNYGFVNHIGHGYRYNMSCGDMSLVNGDASALINTGHFVLYMLNCTAAAYDYPCLAEAFLKSAGGAVAVLGATRSTQPIAAANYNESFFVALHQQGAVNLGAAYSAGRLPYTPNATIFDNADRYTHYLYACLGDPEMIIHTRTIDSTRVTLPSSLSLGTTPVTVQVLAAGTPQAGARVCMQKGTEDYVVGTTDANGEVELLFTAESAGSVQVTVSGQNMTTWVGAIPVELGGEQAAIEIMVADAGNDRLQRFSDSGSHLETLGRAGSSPGYFSNPQGLAFDAAGNLFVADNDNHRIQKLDADGGFLASWGSGASSADGRFDDPEDVAIDAAGNIYVADRDNHRIQKFDNNGGFLAKWGTSGSGAGQFNHPVGVAVDGQGYLFVSDNDNHRVQKWSTSGTFITAWGSLGSGATNFNDPEGIDVDAAGNVYVADRDNHRIQKFSNSGVHILSWGSFGTGNGQFDRPLDVTIADNKVFVADRSNRVQVFDTSGAFLFKFGSSGSGDGQFTDPSGIAIRQVNSGPAYVHVQSADVQDVLGNGDGVLDAGETVEILATFANTGTGLASAVSGSLYVDSPWAEVLDGVYSLGAVGGSTTAATNALRLRVLSGAPDQTVLPLRFETQSGGSTWSDVVNKVVHAPRVELVGLQVLDPFPGGNGNGTAEAGETFDLRPSFKNYGTGAMDAIIVNLSSLDPNVVIAKSATQLSRIDALEETAPDSLLQLSQGAVAESALKLQIVDAFTRLQSWNVTLGRPQAPGAPDLDGSQASNTVVLSWSPSPDADVAGYHVYRASYNLSPWARITTDRTAGITYYRDTGLAPSQHYFYRITAVDSSGNESPPSATSQVDTSPAQVSGWPITMGSQSVAPVAAGDITGDGNPEILAGADQLYAWHSDGTEIHDADANPQTWGVFASTGTVNAAIVLAELDPSPGLEVFAASWSDGHKVFVLRGDGSMAPGWPQNPDPTTLPLGAWGSPAAHDVDADGTSELFVIGKNGILYAWHADGTPLLGSPQFKTNLQTWSTGSPTFADVDGDGASEIIYGARNGTLYVWNADGSDVPGFPLHLGSNCKSSTALGDINGDRRVDIVMITGDGLVHVIDSGTATELPGWPVSVPLNGTLDVQPSPALADLEFDRQLEIVVAVNGSPITASAVYVFNADGTVRSGWPRPVADQHSESSPIVVDVTGDHLPDVLFANQSGLVFGWQRDGSDVPGFPLVVGDFLRGTPFAGDVDNDGDIDLVLAGWDQNVWVWDLTSRYHSEAAQWPTLKHDVHRSGYYNWSDAATDIGDLPVAAVPSRVFLAQNSPNPFNPMTLIEYGVPGSARAEVHIDIFDARGRLVRRLVSASQAPGTYRVIWDGQNDAGRRAESGVYFYKLQVASEIITRKMILVK